MAEPWEIGVWLRLIAYCCKHENKGSIWGCEAWDARKWDKLANVSLEDLRRPSKLWTWAVAQPGVLWVHKYPQEMEEIQRAKREAGRIGGRSQSKAKQEAVRKNGALGGRPKRETKAETKGNSKGKVITVEFDDSLAVDPDEQGLR